MPPFAEAEGASLVSRSGNESSASVAVGAVDFSSMVVFAVSVWMGLSDCDRFTSDSNSFQQPYLSPYAWPSIISTFICASSTKAPTPDTDSSLDDPQTLSFVATKRLMLSAKRVIVAIPDSRSISVATPRAMSNSSSSRASSDSAVALRLTISFSSSSLHSVRRVVASLISFEALLAPLKSRFSAARLLISSSSGICVSNP